MVAKSNQSSKRKPQRKQGLKSWCMANGYGGITSQCITSAKQSPDPKIREQAERAEALQSVYDRREKERQTNPGGV